MSQSRKYAGFLWRVLACLIDFALVMVITFGVAFLAGLILIAAIQFTQLDSKGIDKLATLTGYGVGLVVAVAYFAGFECSAWQATPGKRATGLIVTDFDGKRISFWRALVRFFFKFISGFLFGMAYLVCLFTEHKQTLHDIVSNTLVWKQCKEDQPAAKSVE